MNLNVYLTTYMKINSQWITDLNLRAKIIEFLENIGINLWIWAMIELSKSWTEQWFLRYNPEGTKNRRKKSDKFGFIKIKNFCISKINESILIFLVQISYYRVSSYLVL